MLENGGSWWVRGEQVRSAPRRLISDRSTTSALWDLGPYISGQNKRGLSVIGSIRIVVSVCHSGRKNSCLNSLFLDCNESGWQANPMSAQCLSVCGCTLSFPLGLFNPWVDTGTRNGLFMGHGFWLAIRRMSETWPHSYPIQPLLCDRIYVKCLIWPNLENKEITSHLRYLVIL